MEHRLPELVLVARRLPVRGVVPRLDERVAGPDELRLRPVLGRIRVLRVVARLAHHVDVRAVDERRLIVREQDRLVVKRLDRRHLVRDVEVVHEIDDVAVQALGDVRNLPGVLGVPSPLRPVLAKGERSGEEKSDEENSPDSHGNPPSTEEFPLELASLPTFFGK
jgi:hypothetical protein